MENNQKVPLENNDERKKLEIEDPTTDTDIKFVENYFSDPDLLIKYKEKIQALDQLDKIKHKYKKGVSQKEWDDTNARVVELFGLKNSNWLTYITSEEYRAGLAQIKVDLIKEFQCQNPLELMIIDRIVANYWKAMRYDIVMGMLIDNGSGGFNPTKFDLGIIRDALKVSYYSNRQFSRDIYLLKSLKQPNLKIEVNTGSMYIAQNQQINNIGSVPNKTLGPNDLGNILTVEDCQRININEFLRKYRTEIKEKSLVNSVLDISNQKLSLTTSKTGFNGVRHWFMCPICNKRVGIIYIHPLSKNAGCRKCSGIEYKKVRYKGMIEGSN